MTHFLFEPMGVDRLTKLGCFFGQGQGEAKAGRAGATNTLEPAKQKF